MNIKQKTLIFLGGLLFNASIFADCFLVKEDNKTIMKEGECSARHAPCSTFKIPLSLIGFNEKILIDETHPALLFKAGYADSLEAWKQPHNPQLWMKNSCVWYSQLLTQKLGIKKFQEYVNKFDYGNKDLSGDKGKSNGIMRSWLSSSLEISPDEQMVFLQKLIDGKLSVSDKAYKMTKNILFIEDFHNGWKLYGKTGSGNKLSADKAEKLENRQLGWFIGWLQKGDRTITFVKYIEDTQKQDSYASFRARTAAKEQLKAIIQKL